MPDSLGGISVPDSTSSGLSFPLAPTEFGYATVFPYHVITHRFTDLATKGEQRFQVGIGPKRFTFRRTDLDETDLTALWDFFETIQGSYQTFTYSVPNPDQTTTTFTVRLDDASLTVEELVGACQTGLALVEVPDPSAAPTYSISATLPRFPNSTLQTALLDQVQKLIPLVRIRVLDNLIPDIYLSDRRVTVGGHLYLPRLLNIGEEGSDTLITQTITGAADSVSMSFGNADQVFTALLNSPVDLKFATIELSFFHITTTIKLDLWSGFIQTYQDDESPIFQIRASDGLYPIGMQYPVKTISRTCWKTFNDHFACPWIEKSGVGDPSSCDYYFDSPNGCRSHGMDLYFGGHPILPQGVNVKDNSTGVFGIGRNTVSATSIVSDSAWGQVLSEIWCNDGGDPRKAIQISLSVMAGRDESDFFVALGIVGAGPIGQFTGVYLAANADGFRYYIGSTLDGQFGFGYVLTLDPNKNPNLVFADSGRLVQFLDTHGSVRNAPGNDPGGLGIWDETHQVFDTDLSHWNSSVEAFGLGAGNPPNFGNGRAAGTAFIEIRRTDPSGIQPSTAEQHEMKGFISKGLVGWTWDAAGTRTVSSGITNPAWVAINSYLRALGLFYADSATQLSKFVLSSIIDGAGNGCAEICDDLVTPIFGSGTETQFQFQGIIAQQKAFRDWLVEILNVGMMYFSFEFGKLRLGIRENASAADTFTRGNILYRSLLLQPAESQFDKMVLDFADRDYQFQANVAEYEDKDHTRTYGRPGAPQVFRMHSLGSPTLSQSSRIVATRVREEIGGIDAAEWAKHKLVSWQSTILAATCFVGQVVSITHPKCPDGVIKVRIETMRWKKDYSIEFTGRTVTDSMYDLLVGPKPADQQPLPLPAVFFPIPQGQWAPYEIQAPSNDALFPNEWTFDVGVVYETLADGTIRATLPVKGKLPITEFFPNCGAPTLHRGQITQSTTGGAIPGGKIYRVSLVALSSDNRSSPASEVLYIPVPDTTDTNQLTLSGIIWPVIAGLTSYEVMISDVDDLICAQQTGALTDTSGDHIYTQTSITIPGPFLRSTWAIPNPNIALIRVKQKKLPHAGVAGFPIESVSTNHVTAASTIDVAAIDNWVGRYLISIGRTSGSIPYQSFLITAFNPATGVFTLDRSAAGILQAGDVLAISLLSYDNTLTPRTLTDAGLSNALNFDIVTHASTPHSGLSTNQDKGYIIRVIRGTNRGAWAKITSNTATSYSLDRELIIGTDSIWIVEAAAWELFTDSTRVKSASVTAETTIPIPVDNYLGQSILVGTFTVDLNGIESGEQDAALRMTYIYGQGGSILIDVSASRP